ncbi:MAG: hypothetical protein FWD01_00375, partial [Defluviitaleaceae bacterium]|nr:hypothetical protein [Defluviitaleaceae bacterium]
HVYGITFIVFGKIFTKIIVKIAAFFVVGFITYLRRLYMIELTFDCNNEMLWETFKEKAILLPSIHEIYSQKTGVISVKLANNSIDAVVIAKLLQMVLDGLVVHGQKIKRTFRQKKNLINISPEGDAR